MSQEISELIKLNHENQYVLTEKEKQLQVANVKFEKEFLELKRTNQEKLAEKSNLENQYKKCLDEKKHLSNRIHELSVVGEYLLLNVVRN